MPTAGTIERAKDVGAGTTSHKVIWLPCEQCGHERWVWLRRGQPQSRWCYDCGRRAGARRGSPRGPGHWAWKGGRSKAHSGYIEVWLADDDPLRVMGGKDGYVYEHRLVMARHLGRVLSSEEEVHHRNRRKADNRLENLELLTKCEHSSRHMRRIEELEAEIERLRGLLDEQAPTA